MEYTVKELASLSGVSTRTLRYYDSIGLLKPARLRENGYRVYGEAQVDLLQQILFYRQLDVSLEEIQRIVTSRDFEAARALEGHLAALQKRRIRLEQLIDNVSRTLRHVKGEITMQDKEKFEGFKKQMVEENEQKYGKEIREKYGDRTVNGSNARLMGMTVEEWEDTQKLQTRLNETLRQAVASGDPAGEAATEACSLHKEWLCRYWEKGTYTPQAHLGLAEMYVADERFRKYYEEIAPGAAEFLKAAMANYYKDNR